MLFLGAQLVTNTPFQFSGYIIRRSLPGGPSAIGVSIGSAIAFADCGNLDLVSLDSAGNVKTDTRRERIEARKRYASLSAKYQGNPVVQSLLDSYNASINDPDNALVHLYEIRDALATAFGDEKGVVARRTLRLDRGWGRLEDLANNQPLRQGRHRGWHAGQLRDAAPGEIEEARAVTKGMIEAYLDFLERKP